MRLRTNSPPCLIYTAEYLSMFWMFGLVLSKVFLTMPIATFGILGNALAFIVLWRQRKTRLTTTFLLKCLAIVDTLILVFMVLLQSLRYTDMCIVKLANFSHVYGHMFVVLYPVVFVFRLAEMWLTVMLTIDRFIVVSRLPVWWVADFSGLHVTKGSYFCLFNLNNVMASKLDYIIHCITSQCIMLVYVCTDVYIRVYLHNCVCCTCVRVYMCV